MTGALDRYRLEPMARPSGGCDNCGGPVRTYKPDGWGWVCSKCLKLMRSRDQEKHLEAMGRRAVGRPASGPPIA
jgi:tRNA(Ile2) C34 agmatinyltransferase TiaS